MGTRQKAAKEPSNHSLTKVLFNAAQGLNTVDLYLKEAERRNDPKAVRWLEETKIHYQVILGSAQEFARGLHRPSSLTGELSERHIPSGFDGALKSAAAEASTG